MPAVKQYRPPLELRKEDGMKQKNEWEQLMECLERIPQSDARHVPLHLPNYLLIGEHEERMREEIQRMAQLLKQKGLMRFAGEIPCIFWTMEQDPASFSGLLDALDAHAGFHNRFLGVVALEVTALLEGGETLRRLAGLVRDSYGELLLVCLLHGRESGKGHVLQRLLSEAAPLDVVCFEPVTEEEMTLYLTRRLEEKEVRLSTPARKALARQIAAMREEGDWQSFRTLDNLCELIAYRAGMWNACQKGVMLGMADVRRLDEDFQRLKKSRVRARTIGFGGE